MAIRFRVVDDRAAGFALSPLAEVMLSLHVLLFPKRHPLQHPWIRRMRGLSPELKRRIREFAFLYWDSFPDFILPSRAGDTPSFREQLARIESMPAEAVAYQLARPLFFYYERDGGGPERIREPALRDRVLSVARNYGPASEELATLVFDDPLELRQRLVDLLVGYWHEAFSVEWGRIEPRLREAVAAGEKTVDETGLLSLVEPRNGRALKVDVAARTFTRPSPHEHEVEVTAERPLLLVPSVYVWPSVRVTCDEPWPLALFYPAPFLDREAAREPAPPALVRGLRAAADPTRLRALRLLAERPRSTEELAPLVGLSESGLSKHLRILLEAGLIAQRRDGWYVLYSVDRESLAALPASLLEFVAGRLVGRHDP